MSTDRPRILYLDTPFEHLAGGDKNRSRFLWQALGDAFDVDLALIDSPALRREQPAYTAHAPVASFTPERGPRWRADAVVGFSKADRARFAALVAGGDYALVFARFATGWELLRAAHAARPSLPIVVDVDMLSSRLVWLSFLADPRLRRRWFLMETVKLLAFEQQLFSQPWTLLFTNPNELASARRRVPGSRARFLRVPNPIDALARPRIEATRRGTLLFFGVLRSLGNADAYRYLREEILPLVADDLDRHGAHIEVAGVGAPPEWQQELDRAGEERIRVIGKVDSVDEALAQAMAVLLPQRAAAGTLTRVLEAAAQQTSVLTTPAGADGLQLDDALLVGADAAAFAAHLRRLLTAPEERERRGRLLRERAAAMYAPEIVASTLVQTVRAALGAG